MKHCILLLWIVITSVIVSGAFAEGEATEQAAAEVTQEDVLAAIQNLENNLLRRVDALENDVKKIADAIGANSHTSFGGMYRKLEKMEDDLRDVRNTVRDIERRVSR